MPHAKARVVGTDARYDRDGTSSGGPPIRRSE